MMDDWSYALPLTSVPTVRELNALDLPSSLVPAGQAREGYNHQQQQQYSEWDQRSRLLGELPGPLIGYMRLSDGTFILYFFLFMFYTAFLYTSRTRTTLAERVLVGLIFAKTVDTSLAAGYYAYWDSTGNQPSDSLRIVISVVGSLAQGVLYYISLLACHGWNVLPRGLSKRAWFTTSTFFVVTMVIMFSSTFHLFPHAKVFRDLTVILYAVWCLCAMRQTQKTLRASTGARNSSRFLPLIEFRCRMMFVSSMYISSFGYFLWFHLCRRHISAGWPNSLMVAACFIIIAADLLVLIAMARLWRCSSLASRGRNDGDCATTVVDKEGIFSLQTGCLAGWGDRSMFRSMASHEGDSLFTDLESYVSDDESLEDVELD